MSMMPGWADGKIPHTVGFALSTWSVMQVTNTSCMLGRIKLDVNVVCFGELVGEFTNTAICGHSLKSTTSGMHLCV
jgi:hypothetical protein